MSPMVREPICEVERSQWDQSTAGRPRFLSEFPQRNGLRGEFGTVAHCPCRDFPAPSVDRITVRLEKQDATICRKGNHENRAGMFDVGVVSMTFPIPAETVLAQLKILAPEQISALKHLPPQASSQWFVVSGHPALLQQTVKIRSNSIRRAPSLVLVIAEGRMTTASQGQKVCRAKGKLRRTGRPLPANLLGEREHTRATSLRARPASNSVMDPDVVDHHLCRESRSIVWVTREPRAHSQVHHDVEVLAKRRWPGIELRLVGKVDAFVFLLLLHQKVQPKPSRNTPRQFRLNNTQLLTYSAW